MPPASTADIRAERAQAAMDAVLRRHLRRLWAVPGTALGIVGWPASAGERLFGRWHYWWQAHLLDCLVDAWRRDPRDDVRQLVRRQARGQLLRNGLRWTNRYYDDMAWLALSLLRARSSGLVDNSAAIRRLTGRILDGWSASEGALPWRVGDDFHNAPANGPAAILLARTGYLDRAAATASWIEHRLHDLETGLVLDGLHPGRPIARDLYTYCQGVVLGAETELALRTSPERSVAHVARVAALVSAVDRHLAVDKVLVCHGGGNGGLFSGILARYLAVVADRLPGADERAGAARRVSALLVTASADAAWANRATAADRPVFGPHWQTAARVPTTRRPGRRSEDGASSAPEAEHDLSVQLGGWMLMEAAARVARHR